MIIPILQLTLASGSGVATIRRFLLAAERIGFANTKDLFESIQDTMKVIGVKEDVARNVLESRTEAESLAKELKENNIEVLWRGHPQYPVRFERILGDDAPPVIYTKGNLALLLDPAVGFCGSRKASDKGLLVTERCAGKLAGNGICIVSGYAHGVDMAAHRAALSCDGNTIFVLVEGILRFRQKADISNLTNMDNHLIISQFSPRLSWNGRNAMARNSTIIGLSDAMILVESGLTGGTFAAGEETIKRGQPLFVIDFKSPSLTAAANPYFIKRGSIPIRGNQEGVPNLAKVRKVIADQSLHNNRLVRTNLFSQFNP